MPAQLHVIDVSKDGTTGYITVRARIIDPDDPVHGYGAEEKYGMEALEIVQRFHGDVEEFLQWIGRDMLQKHRGRTAVHTDIGKWKGKRIEIK